jgi:hypothetical protein
MQPDFPPMLPSRNGCLCRSVKSGCPVVQFKSTEESQSKTAANLNDHYTKVANTPDAKKHLTMVLDTLIWQYVPDMLQLLQQKGFHFKVPKVPALINRHKKHR